MRRKTAQALALRARIVLACAEGIDNKTVATRQCVTSYTVSKWRSRFINHRVDGLLEPCSGWHQPPDYLDCAVPLVRVVVARDVIPRHAASNSADRGLFVPSFSGRLDRHSFNG